MPLQLEPAWPVRHEADGEMSGRGAEVDAAVRLGGEVTAVTTFAVQADAPAADQAVVDPVPEVGAKHAFNLGSARCARGDPS